MRERLGACRSRYGPAPRWGLDRTGPRPHPQAPTASPPPPAPALYALSVWTRSSPTSPCIQADGSCSGLAFCSPCASTYGRTSTRLLGNGCSGAGGHPACRACGRKGSSERSLVFASCDCGDRGRWGPAHRFPFLVGVLGSGKQFFARLTVDAPWIDYGTAQRAEIAAAFHHVLVAARLRATKAARLTHPDHLLPARSTERPPKGRPRVGPLRRSGTLRRPIQAQPPCPLEANR